MTDYDNTDLTTPSPDGFSDFDQIQQYLNVQANQLVKQGADPAQVEQLLQQRTQALSQVWDKWGAAAFQNRNPVTVEDVAGTPPAQAGLLSAAEGPPSTVITSVPQKPAQDSSWSPADSDVDLHGSGQIFASMANPVLATGRGLLAAGAGAANLVGFDQDTTDPIFDAADKLKQYQEDLPQVTTTADKLIQAPGAALTGAATLGLGSGGAKGMDVISKGGSLDQAESALGIDTLATEGTLALGVPFASVPARMATQAVGNVAAQEGARQWTNSVLPADQQEAFDPISAATAFGTGAAFGAIPHGGETAPIRTGDKGVDAGLSMADGVKASKGVTDSDVADAIKSSQNDKDFGLNKEFLKESGGDDNTPDTKVNLSDHGFNEDQIKAMSDKGMADADGTMDREQYWNYRENKDQLPQTEKPRIKVPVEDVPTSQVKDSNDLYPDAQENDDSPITRTKWKDALAEKLGDTDSSKIAASTDTSSGIPKSVSGTVLEALDKGELTSQHALDAVADNHGNRFSTAPEASAYADVLRKAGENLGGLDTKIELFDPKNNPEHAVIAQEDPRMLTNAAFYDSRANKIYVNGESNLKPSVLVHEAAHGITHKAIDMGLAGDLTGPQNRSFKTLQTLFDGIRDHIANNSKDWSSDTILRENNRVEHIKKLEIDRANPQNSDINNKTLDTLISNERARAWQKQEKYDPRTYGLTDLHEMTSELFSSGAFRDHLKSIKLSDLKFKQGSEGSLARMALAKVRNAYDAVVGSVRGMLGLSPKADNALDAMFSGTHDFLNSFDGDAVKQVRDSNSRNTALPRPKDDDKFYNDRPDPLSRWQEWKSNAKFVTGRVLGIRGAPEKTISNAKAEATGATNESRFQAERLAKDMMNASKAENSPDGAVHNYITGSDPTVLDNSPKTKALADQFRTKANDNAREIAKQILANPAARTADYKFAHAVLENPTYAFRGYQGEGFSRNLLLTARAGDRALAKGQTPSSEQLAAIKIRGDVRDWARAMFMPGDSIYSRNLNSLRNTAKALGIDTPRALDGVRGSAAKKAKLIELVNKALPAEADVNKALDRLVNEIAGVTNRANSPVAKYYRGVRLGDIMTERSQVPPQLRALWGEIKNPADVVVSTLVKQQRGIAQMKEQANILKTGTDNGWLHGSKMDAPDGFTERLNGRKFGSLQGQYTTPTVKRLLAAHVELSTASQTLSSALHSGEPVQAVKDWLGKSAMNLWTSGVGNFKALRLGTDVGYYVMYAAGGPSIGLMNGVINPVKYMRGAVAHISEIMPGILKHLPDAVRKQAEQDVSDVLKSGFNEANQAGELTNEADHRKIAEAISNGSIDSLGNTVQSVLGHYIGKGRNALTTALSLTDGYAKRAALFERMDQLEGLYNRSDTSKTHEDIRAEAADWVKDTVITNSRSPLWSRLIERLGIGQGVTYGVETLRNTMNAYLHGASDIVRGTQMKDPIFVAHGAKQLMGATAAVGYMGTVISALGGTLLGTIGIASKFIPSDDKKQEYLQQDKSPFQGQRPEELIDSNSTDPNNKYLWAPGDRNDFYYQASQPVHVLIDAIDRSNKGEKVDIEHEVKNAVAAFSGTFWHNGFTSRVLDLVQAKAPYWEKQQTPDQYLQQQAALVNRGFSPEVADAFLTLEDLIRPGVVRNYDIAQAATGASPQMKDLMTAGLGVKQIPSDTGLASAPGTYGTGKGIVAEAADNKKLFTAILESPAKFSDEAVTKSYQQAFKADYKTLQKLQQDIDFGKANNVNLGVMVQHAKAAGISDDMMIEALSGQLNPAKILWTDMSSKMNKQLQDIGNDPVKMKDMAQTYGARARLLVQLTAQYAKLTPDQIEAM